MPQTPFSLHRIHQPRCPAAYKPACNTDYYAGERTCCDKHRQISEHGAVRQEHRRQELPDVMHDAADSAHTGHAEAAGLLQRRHRQKTEYKSCHGVKDGKEISIEPETTKATEATDGSEAVENVEKVVETEIVEETVSQ